MTEALENILVKGSPNYAKSCQFYSHVAIIFIIASF